MEDYTYKVAAMYRFLDVDDIQSLRSKIYAFSEKNELVTFGPYDEGKVDKSAKKDNNGIELQEKHKNIPQIVAHSDS